MVTNQCNRHTITIGILAVLAGLAFVGCGDTDNTPKHSSRKGKVTSINPQTGEVRMMSYTKEGKEREVVGTLGQDAEITINGRTARLEEVMVDDPVEVTGRIEKHDGEVKLIALKVFVTRPDTSQPATEPATRPLPNS
jgi:hypothetical protein